MKREASVLFALLLSAMGMFGNSDAAVVDRVSIVAPDSGVVRGIDSVLVVETAVRATQVDSGLAVFFWLVESGTDSLVLADTTTGGATGVTDSIKTAIGASAAHFASRAPNSFIAARRAKQASLTPAIGDGDSIAFVRKPDARGIADSLIFTWYCKIPASAGTFNDVRAAVAVHDPTLPGGSTLSMVAISPANRSVRVDGDRPEQGTAKLDSVVAGGGKSVSGFSTTSTRTVLGIGDTVKIAYDLGDKGDAVLLLDEFTMMSRVFGKNFAHPAHPLPQATYDLVLGEGMFGDLTDPATVDSDTIAFYLVDEAGNLSSVSKDDVAPTGSKQAVQFVVDTKAPVLDNQVAAGDTLLPASGDTLTDGTLHSGYANDERRLIFNLAEGLDSLKVVFDGDVDATAVLRSGLQLGDFALRRATGTSDSRALDFTALGDPGNGDTLVVASLDGASSQIFSSAAGNARIDRRGDSLRTGPHTLRLRATDLAGNVGPELVRTDVYLDVDDIQLVRLTPSSAGQDTLNAQTARVSFRLSEPADSVMITYRGLDGDVDGMRTRALSGTQLTNTTSEQVFEVEGLVAGSRYEFSVLARDLAGNFTRSRPDTFVYDLNFAAPSIDRFAVEASKSGLGSPLFAGEEVTLTIEALAADGRKAVGYEGDAVLSVNGGRGVAVVTADDKSQHVTDEGAGRILLGRDGWISGRRSLVIRDTSAVDTLRVTVADSADAESIHTGALDSLIVVQPERYSLIAVEVPDTVEVGETFRVGLALADRFGNRRPEDDRFVSASANMLGIELPPGEIYVEEGEGGFWARSAGWSGEGLVFTVRNLLSPVSFPDTVAALGGGDRGGYQIVGKSAPIVVLPEPEDLLDAPDAVEVSDYMGADGQGDQGGFLLLSFDLSEDHETLTGYRIWREIQVGQRAAEGGGLTALEEPELKYIPWGLVDPVPGVEGSLDVVVATLDDVASRWAVSAERGRETTAKEIADAEMQGSAYELMAETMRRSRSPRLPAMAALTPEATAYALNGVVPRLQGREVVQSSRTATERAVAAIDNIAPLPVASVRAFDTPDDAGGSVTVNWTPSLSDRPLSSSVPLAVGGERFTTDGVVGYRIERSAGGGEFAPVGTVGAGASTFVDGAAFNGVSYHYRVVPFDGQNSAEPGPVDEGMAIRNRVVDSQGEVVLGLLGRNDRVDFDDFFALAAQFGRSAADPGFEPAFDLSPNNRIGKDDLAVVGNYFGQGIAAGVEQDENDAADGGAHLSLSMAEGMPRAGEEFAVELNLEREEGMRAYGFQIGYPEAELEFVGVQAVAGELGQGELASPLPLVERPGELAIAAFGDETVERVELRLLFRMKGEAEAMELKVVQALLLGGGPEPVAPALPEPLQVESLPVAYRLQQNFPNPFNPETTIRYQLPEATAVRLEVFDALGRRVQTLVEEPQSAGRYAIGWNGLDENGRGVASGLYFYRLKAGDRFEQVAKMLLLK